MPANFVFLVETGFFRVGQAGLELPTLGDPLSSPKVLGLQAWATIYVKSLTRFNTLFNKVFVGKHIQKAFFSLKIVIVLIIFINYTNISWY